MLSVGWSLWMICLSLGWSIAWTSSSEPLSSSCSKIGSRFSPCSGVDWTATEVGGAALPP
jgi:hypothetical protein